MDTLTNTTHRPWPVPAGPWIMSQTWHNLLFAHWPCPPELLRPLVPEGVELDTFQGQAWVGIVAFRLTGIRLHGFPLVPLFNHFAEVNVRTYVNLGDKPGVYFLSLDADNPLAIAIARPWFHLAYRRAHINFAVDGDTVSFESERTEQGQPPAHFAGSYRPVAGVHKSVPGTLENWLTERYCFYATNRRGQLYCGEVHHRQWALQQAEAQIEVNTMFLSHGIALHSTQPLLHYAHHMQALFWNARRPALQPHPELKEALSNS